MLIMLQRAVGSNYLLFKLFKYSSVSKKSISSKINQYKYDALLEIYCFMIV